MLKNVIITDSFRSIKVYEVFLVYWMGGDRKLHADKDVCVCVCVCV